MLKKIRQSITALAFAMMAFAPLAVPASVAAQANIQDELQQGACLSTNAADCAADPEGSINNLLSNIINIFSFVVGAVAVVMIIIGGFKYITSNGNDSNVASAKNTILYAIIGLVIVAFAQFIVRFVLTRID